MLFRPPVLSDEKHARQGHQELAQDRAEFLLDLERGTAWPVCLGRLESLRLGVDLPEDGAPVTFLVADAEGQAVGRVSIRHELNAYLAELGAISAMQFAPAFAASVMRPESCANPWRSRRRLGLSVCRLPAMPTTLAPSKSLTIALASGGERRAGLRRVGAQTPVLGRGRLVRKSMDLSNGRTSAAGGDRGIRDLRIFLGPEGRNRGNGF